MPVKILEIPDLGAVSLQKHKGSRSIKIHIQGSKVKVTLPNHVPYIVAEKYLQAKKSWVLANLSKKTVIANGSFIGKNHQVIFRNSELTSSKTRVNNGKIFVDISRSSDSTSPHNQKVILAACERALKKEASDLIIPRLQDIALENGFIINNAKVKKLRSRWGSCDSHKNITLNIFLAQLPWKLIDYVLVHELAHTKHLNHSTQFWQEVESILPDYKIRRKETKSYSPDIINS